MMPLSKMGCGKATLVLRGVSSNGVVRRGGRLAIGGHYQGVLARKQLSSTLTKAPPSACKPSTQRAPITGVAIGQQAAATGGKKVPDSSSLRALHARFHEAMVKPRQPLKIIGWQTTTNLSNLCGHASFIFMAIAYLETDVLLLRGCAVSGISCAIMFQYYRAQPLWISIGWNSLFMIINCSMIGLLLKQANDAVKLGDDPEQSKMFEEIFMPVELRAVDFVRLLDLGERRVVPKGGKLSQEGSPQEEVHLIVDGKAEVSSRGSAVGHLESKQFVGSMSFLRFINAAAAQEVKAQAEAKALADMEDGKTESSASEAELLADAIAEVSEANDSDDSAELVEETEEADDESPLPNGKGGVMHEARRAGEVALGLIRHDSVVGEVAKTLLPGRHKNLARPKTVDPEKSNNTVTVTTDSVVYSWDMHLLRAYIKRHPMAGVSLQTAISADLTRKVDQSRAADERYRLLLGETLKFGKITPIEKQKLQRFRENNGIGEDVHKMILEQHKWSGDEYEAGFQRGAVPKEGSRSFLEYEELVRKELAGGEVKPETRQQLRQYRAKAGIDPQEHLLALAMQGWTADDYEEGLKLRSSNDSQWGSALKNLNKMEGTKTAGGIQRKFTTWQVIGPAVGQQAAAPPPENMTLLSKRNTRNRGILSSPISETRDSQEVMGSSSQRRY